MARRSPQWYLSYLLLIALFLTMMPAATVNTAPYAGPHTGPSSDTIVTVSQTDPGDNEPAGLTIVLSDGAAQPSEASQMPVAETTPLTAGEVQQISDRLPPMEVEAGDQEEFRLPERSLPPPKHRRDHRNESFPPAEAIDAPAVPDETEVGPLEVLRYAPEGAGSIGAFSQRDLQPAHGPAGDIGTTGQRRRAGYADA